MKARLDRIVSFRPFTAMKELLSRRGLIIPRPLYRRSVCLTESHAEVNHRTEGVLGQVLVFVGNPQTSFPDASRAATWNGLSSMSMLSLFENPSVRSEPYRCSSWILGDAQVILVQDAESLYNVLHVPALPALR